MRHLMSLDTVAALSISSLARAGEAQATRESALTRRLFLPSLVGVGVGAQPLAGACPLSTGLFSYLNSNGGDGSHYEAFVLRPSFDVRVGKVTTGTDSSVAYLYSRWVDGGAASGVSLRLQPRVGVMSNHSGRRFLAAPRRGLRLRTDVVPAERRLDGGERLPRPSTRSSSSASAHAYSRRRARR